MEMFLKEEKKKKIEKDLIAPKELHRLRSDY